MDIKIIEFKVAKYWIKIYENNYRIDTIAYIHKWKNKEIKNNKKIIKFIADAILTKFIMNVPTSI